MTETEQVQAAQLGDTRALAALCIRYDRLVHKLAFERPYRLLGEDGLAQARLSLIEGIYAFDVQKGVPVTAYLCGRIRQDLWRDLRRIRRLREREGLDDGSPSGLLVNHSAGVILEDLALDQLSLDFWQSQLEALPDRQKAVLQGLVQEQTVNELAEILGISLQAVYALRNRARAGLKSSRLLHVVE